MSNGSEVKLVFIPQAITEKLNESGLEMPSFESTTESLLGGGALNELEELTIFKALQEENCDFEALVDRFRRVLCIGSEYKDKDKIRRWLNRRGFYKDGIPVSLIENAKKLYEELNNRKAVIQCLMGMNNPATGKKVTNKIATITMKHVTRHTPEGRRRSKGARMGSKLEVLVAELFVSEGFAGKYDYIPRGSSAPIVDLETNRGSLDIKAATFKTNPKTLNQYLNYCFNQPADTIYIVIRAPRDGKYHDTDVAFIKDEYFGIVTPANLHSMLAEIDSSHSPGDDKFTLYVSIAKSGPPMRATEDYPSNVIERGVKWMNKADFLSAFRTLPIKFHSD